VVAEPASEGDHPTVTLDREKHAQAALVRWSGSNDGAFRSRQIVRTPPKEARGVADADFDFLLRGTCVTERLEPGTGARAAAAGINHELAR
jgi:hypothetical protein